MKTTLFLSLTLVVAGAYAGVSNRTLGQTPSGYPPANPRPTPLPGKNTVDYPDTPSFPNRTREFPIYKNDRYEFQPTSGQMKEAKAVLKQHGLYTGKENGKLDKETKTALKAYQRARSLKPTGMLDKSTLADMGISLTKEQERREERYTQIRPRGK
jgi:hypothetical protein